MSFDLLSTVEAGGCSAKLSPMQLSEILSDLPVIRDSHILVDLHTHDDAGVYQINDETALIVTTDFFPPVCSDAYDFGQIAAANALSDVYAMGGDPLLVLNLMMFSPNLVPLEEFKRILIGGQEKVTESGALILGGHTIDDHPPKYGLAVVGTVHPSKLITNAGASEGQALILTKPLGTGIMISAHKLNLADKIIYEQTLTQMKALNRNGKNVMQKFGVKGATDITGFGLAGHAMQMARASQVSFRIETCRLPVLPQTISLIEQGCIPGAAYRNQKYVSDLIHYSNRVDFSWQMMTCDAQTSGGLLFAIDKNVAGEAVTELHQSGMIHASIVGEVLTKGSKTIYFE